MKTIILTLLIGTILAVACASPAPSKLQSLQALLKGVEEEKQVQLQMDDDDDDDVDVEKALLNLIQQKMALMQDDDDDDDKLADAQLIRKLWKYGKKLLGWWFYSSMAWKLLECPTEHNNLVTENHNEHLSGLD